MQNNTTKNITILLDLDDVLTPFMPTLIEEYNKYHNTNHTIEEIDNWDTPNQIFNPLLWSIVETSNILEVMPLKDGAYDVIEKWYNNGYNIFIASACGHHEYVQKLTWLKYVGLDKFIKELIPIKNKYLLKADIFIDDYIGNLKPFKDANDDSVCILMEAQHNKYFVGTDKDEFIRVKNWKEIDKWVDLIIDK